MAPEKHDDANHANHFCELSKRDMEEVDRLTRDPKFRCLNCGRLANSASSVCTPRGLTPEAIEELRHDEANHPNHLCEVFIKDKKEYARLTDDPKYRCANCGRVAHSAKSLCNPRELK